MEQYGPIWPNMEHVEHHPYALNNINLQTQPLFLDVFLEKNNFLSAFDVQAPMR